MKQTLPQGVILDRNVCGSLERAEQHEWWLANGIGGYAGATVAGTLTRRYHGLLIAAPQSELQRQLFFARADAELLDGDQVIPLYTNRVINGAIEPDEPLRIESFRLDGRMPVWRYRLNDLLIEARIWMEHGRHSTSLAWRLLENPQDKKVRLRVRLLANVRDHHGISGFTDNSLTYNMSDHELDVSYPDSPCLHFASRCGEVQQANYWVDDFDLPSEHDRSLAEHDRHLCIGHMTFPVYAGHWVGLTASIESDEPAYYIVDAMQRFQERDIAMLTRAKIIEPEFTQAPAWIEQLILAADSFVINYPQVRNEIVAAYPWLGERICDSMIALPGLLLTNGRYQEAHNLLSSCLPFVESSMLPDFFPGDGKLARYNTWDAALWYIEAWGAYFKAIRDLPSITHAWPMLQQIIKHYHDETRSGICLDSSDGLLRTGELCAQFTGMNAWADGKAITPRTGKPVEINALWYNALQTMTEFAHALNDGVHAKEYSSLAATTRSGFQKFIRPDHQGLFDVLDGPDGSDESIRPNQIFAVSLPFSPLNPEDQRDVVAICAKRLLTPYGLRSLDPASPDYCPNYMGEAWSRGRTYHQGTVWAWLLGHFALAEYRVSGNAKHVLSRLDSIQTHLKEAGLGTISEIFDGDVPHTPRGCPAQAWSVACILEAWLKLHRAQSKHDKEHKHDRQHS